MSKPVPIGVQAKLRSDPASPLHADQEGKPRPSGAPRDAPEAVAPARVRSSRPRQGKRLVLMLGVVVLVALIAAFAWVTGGRYVVVDDAYVRAAKLMVTTDVSGIVRSVEVAEGSNVRRGDVLFRIDPRQFENELANAKAQLAGAELAVEAMRLDYKRLVSAIDAQQAQVDLATATHDRYKSLVEKKAVSRAVFDQARYSLMAAQKTLESLKQEAAVQLAKLGGNPDLDIETHPQHRQARAVVAEAQRKLDHATVRAPFDGIVTKVEALQPGTFLVAPTAALTNMGAVALVSTTDVWVEANIKETDLTNVRPGNEVGITVDTYPGRKWPGRIETISPASGAEFSILPAQNASGNWIKITQRVPVRIKIERKADDPVLRAGMSVVVRIDTRHRRAFSDLVPFGLLQ